MMLAESAAACPGEGPPLLVRVRRSGVEVSQVEVLDLSLAGCMLDWRGWALLEEQRVLVSFPTLPNLPATVLWAEKHRVGLLFNHPLHEAVHQHLVSGHTFAGE